jgi:tRNA(His) guanylyltransferase
MRALDLMNQAAVAVMKDLTDIVVAYGVSDEFRYSRSAALSPLVSQ